MYLSITGWHWWRNSLTAIWENLHIILVLTMYLENVPNVKEVYLNVKFKSRMGSTWELGNSLDSIGLWGGDWTDVVLLAAVFFPLLVKVLLIAPQSVGRLAKAWKTCLFRMTVYTKLEFPSNWYWMILLNISSKKKTKWWLVGLEKRNQGVLNASNRWRSLHAANIDMDLMYGDTLHNIVSRQSKSGWSLWCPVVMI